MENIKIGIAGMGPQSGSSFVTMMLAEYLALSGESGNVTVASAGSMFFYDSLGMEKRFEKGSFVPFERYSEYFNTHFQNGDIVPPNMSEGISWVVSSPETAVKR